MWNNAVTKYHGHPRFIYLGLVVSSRPNSSGWHRVPHRLRSRCLAAPKRPIPSSHVGPKVMDLRSLLLMTRWWFQIQGNYVNNGINHQPQLVSRISEPSTAYLGGGFGFNDFLFSRLKLGKWSNLTKSFEIGLKPPTRWIFGITT